MSAVIYGKHPAFGDFLAHGLYHAVFAKLDAWANDTLPEVQNRLGDQWEHCWKTARPCRFWFGPEVLGVPLIGIMSTSQDKVGRRFPLIFGLTGDMVPPPTDPAHDEGCYDVLWAHMAAFEIPDDGLKGGAALLEGFVEPDVHGVPWAAHDSACIWGRRQDGDLGRLLHDAVAAETAKAQVSRTHWWRVGQAERGEPADWMATTGLPDAAAMCWLLTGEG